LGQDAAQQPLLTRLYGIHAQWPQQQQHLGRAQTIERLAYGRAVRREKGVAVLEAGNPANIKYTVRYLLNEFYKNVDTPDEECSSTRFWTHLRPFPPRLVLPPMNGQCSCRQGI